MLDFGDDAPAGSSRPKKPNYKKGLQRAGSSLSETGREMTDSAREETSSNIHAVQYHRGGKVRKTGEARLLKGERVIPRSKVKKVERMMKRGKVKMRGGKR